MLLTDICKIQGNIKPYVSIWQEKNFKFPSRFRTCVSIMALAYRPGLRADPGPTFERPGVLRHGRPVRVAVMAGMAGGVRRRPNMVAQDHRQSRAWLHSGTRARVRSGCPRRVSNAERGNRATRQDESAQSCPGPS